jgi:cobalt/nickel transport system ATP-binding protein
MEASVQSDAAIQLHGLSFTYPGNMAALNLLSFEIAAGECVGLIGPNGAGKTTLFLCLSGVLTVREGMVRVVGLDPSRPAERRRLPSHVGIVFQNSDDQLFNTTVFDDVAFGPLNLGLSAEDVKQRVAESLAWVDLQGFEQRVPFHLSGGEKQRVALAGVLAMRPQILLLDEPTLHLDPRGRRELIGLLKNLPGTKVIASHDLEMILESCERILLLDQGRLVADGLAREVLGDAALMDAHGLEVPYSLRGPWTVDRGP